MNSGYEETVTHQKLLLYVHPNRKFYEIWNSSFQSLTPFSDAKKMCIRSLSLVTFRRVKEPFVTFVLICIKLGWCGTTNESFGWWVVQARHAQDISKFNRKNITQKMPHAMSNVSEFEEQMTLR
jgi:hypothetical protein